MNYYEVAIGAEKHWDRSEFTYSYEGNLSVGDLVNAPFGRKNKAGIVVRKTNKPTFPVKNLTPYDDIHINVNTLDFIEWYQKYYNAKQGQVNSQLLPNYLTKSAPKSNDKPQSVIFTATLKLNKQQTTAKSELLSTTKPSVLHGITGAGKTRLYLSLITDTLKSGKSALLLYPEISLTSQLLAEVREHAPVVAFHSNLTDAQRSKLWFHIAAATEPMVVIGPRSSLFVPYKDLGLIIIDEAHESTYKQDSDIRYNSILTAGGLAKAHKGAKLIIGSATPPLTESELIINSGGNLVCIHDKAIINTDYKTRVHVVDRKDRKQFQKHHLISNLLLNSIENSLSNKKQSLLFINRRGTAKLTICEHCGWQASCPDCELPVTYHHDVHQLICHTCGKHQKIQSVCPECSQKTSLKSLGSKAIVDEVQRIFPEAKVARFDTDNKKGEAFHELYDDIKSGKIDILIGTQQIVKGLDLPLLSTVGILDADLSLHFPDFSSDERTFQLISQVSGRVGRGHGNGEIFVQTLHPNNQVIELATREDWHRFREIEMENRKIHNFPPYIFAAKVIFRDKSQAKAFSKAEKSEIILSKISNIEIDGPLPSFSPKRGGYYYVQIHVKSKSRAVILKALSSLNDDEIYDLDPTTFL